MTFAYVFGRLCSLPLLFLKYAVLPISRPLRFRRALEDLGGVFIKFGELLAMRFDLLPLPYALELLNLRQKTTIIPAEKLFRIFEEETGKPIRNVFETVDEQPTSVTVFYQSYRAALAGNDVIVKIQKPGVRARSRADLLILRFLGSLLDDIGIFRRISFLGAIRQLEEWLADELDCAVEAQNSSTLHDHAHQHPGSDFVVPIVYKDFTQQRVLVREYLPGMKVDRILEHLLLHPDDIRAALEKNAIRPDEAANRIVRDIMRQYFVDGFFCLNPYPSTLLLLPENRFSHMDFGIIGKTAYPTASFLAFFKAALNLETLDAANALVDFAEAPTEAPFAKFTASDERARTRFQKTLEFLRGRIAEDLTPVLNRWRAPSGSDEPAASVAATFVAITKILRVYKLSLPHDAIAFLRALLMLDRIALKLHPSFALTETLQGFLDTAPVADAIAIPEAHEEETESINEFESLETVNISPEATSEFIMREAEHRTLEQERFESWITTLTERLPELYQDIKYL